MNNFVHKHAHKYNKSAVFVDKKKESKKGKLKHKNKRFDRIIHS